MKSKKEMGECVSGWGKPSDIKHLAYELKS